MRKVKKEMWETYDGTLFEEEEEAQDYELGILLEQQFKVVELDQKITRACFVGQAVEISPHTDTRDFQRILSKQDDDKCSLKEWLISNRVKLLEILKQIVLEPPARG